MSFLSPLMLLGLLGAAIPVAIHLLGRQRAKVVRFSALHFLLKSDKKFAKRLRVREWLLLAMRALICLALPLVLAQPYSSCEQPGPAVERGPQAAVLIVDNSLGSRYRHEGRTLLQQSVRQALMVLEQLGPEAEVALLTTGDGMASHDELSRDHLAIQERLRSTRSTFVGPDHEAAFRQAEQLLSGSGHEQKTVFYFATATEANVPKEAPWPADGPRIQHISPSGEAQLPNLALAKLDVHPDGSVGSKGVKLRADVANHSKERKLVQLTLRIDDEIVATGELEVGAGQVQGKSFSANLDDDTRVAEISVELEEDGLREDNRRYALADARDDIPVLLVNGDARTIRHEDELYYVEAALRPGDRSDSGLQVTTTTPDGLAKQELEDLDVIILANVPALPRDQVPKLQEWVRNGGGLFISMGDGVDPDSYNQSMTRLLPQTLQSKLDLQHGRKDEDRMSSGLRLSKLELEHPIFSVFSKEAPGLYQASFDKIMLLGPTTNVQDRRVLARFDNGAAALVEARLGTGTLLLFTSSLDRDWNNLAIHPGFLPFLQQSIRHLAAKPFRASQADLFVGSTRLVKLTATDRRVEVQGPSGRRDVIEGDRLVGRKHARIDAIEEPGIYRVEVFDDKGDLSPRPGASFAANLDPQYSQLGLVPTDSLRGGSGEGTGSGKEKSHERRVELWHGIALALLLLLLLESLASLYGDRRTRQRA